MEMIHHARPFAQPTIRYKLEERTTRPDGHVECTGVETGYDRNSGLRRFEQRIRQYPDRYRNCRRLVLVESDGGGR